MSDEPGSSNDTIVADSPDCAGPADPGGSPGSADPSDAVGSSGGPSVGPDVLAKPVLRGWSHLLAFATLIVLGAVIVDDAADTDRGPLLIVIYVAGTGAMFGVSAAYHRLRWQPPARALMSKLDHCTIFLAIAGAYTPMAVVTLTGWHRTSVLVTVWGGSVVGIAL